MFCPVHCTKYEILECVFKHHVNISMNSKKFCFSTERTAGNIPQYSFPFSPIYNLKDFDFSTSTVHGFIQISIQKIWFCRKIAQHVVAQTAKRVALVQGAWSLSQRKMMKSSRQPDFTVWLSSCALCTQFWRCVSSPCCSSFTN